MCPEAAAPGLGGIMSRLRISRQIGVWRVGVTLGILLGLTGCLGGNRETGPNMSDSPIFSEERATPRADLVRQKSVMGGSVTIATPKGFCIDTTSYQDTPSGAFVPIGACAALTKDPGDPKPKKAAFLTATVLPMPVQATVLPNDPDARMREARAFIQSEKGRATLSRVGDATTVTLLDTKSAANVLYVQVKDTADGLPSALSNTTWRAFFEVNGQLVTASATAFADQPFGQGKGYQLLTEFVAAIRKANPGAKSGGGLKALLGGLRN